MVVHVPAAQALYLTEIIQVHALGASQDHQHTIPLEDAAAAATAEEEPLVESLQVQQVQETTSTMNPTTIKDLEVAQEMANGVHFVN